VPGRGTLTGNRGVLHTPDRQLVRDSQVRRWIACRLEFRGRHRQVMSPNSWTELFFLDEAAALAVGHRPCAECRHADYVAFQSAWRRVYPTAPADADAMDAVLHAERRVRPWVKRTHVADWQDLPDGTYVALEGQAWLVLGPALLAWSPERYPRPPPATRPTQRDGPDPAVDGRGAPGGLSARPAPQRYTRILTWILQWRTRRFTVAWRPGNNIRSGRGSIRTSSSRERSLRDPHVRSSGCML